ncbi:DUF917 domain-containing protein [Actinokineospora sp.]|uniref:DUF917 domain-containing protein n=1 Tax=Actinokineospora sp. TaxID=1872133 RepID=UPI0040382589
MDQVQAGLVDDLVHGAGVLAAGAAAPWRAAGPVRAALARHGPVRLVAPAELAPDALVLAVDVRDAGLDWPGDGAVRALVRAAEDRAGRRCAAVLPIEAGGTGALAAVHVAAVLGLSCVDGDGQGRGFGRVDLTLFALGGLVAEPVLVGGADVVAVRTADNTAAHRLAAAAAAAMPGPVVLGAYPMTGAQCARLAAEGALRDCLGLGAALRGRSPTAVRPLFTGCVTHVARDSATGGVRGTATVEAPESARTLRLDFQHGNLVASEDGLVSVTVPDLICVVDTASWLPVSSRDLEPGQHVHVLTLPADPRWRLPDGLAAAGPRRFGYDIDYGPATDRTVPCEHTG